DARAAGEWFTQHKLDLIFSSPLGRAEQTAKIIQREVGMPGRKVELLTDLQEIDTGIFTGRKSQDLQAEHPQIWADFKRHSWEAVPDAERISELEARS